jgi:putative transposase
LIEGAEGIFENENGKKAKAADTDEPQTAELYEQIGRLKVQLEWLKKKVAQVSE